MDYGNPSGINPNISLGVTGGQTPSGVGNALGMVDSIANIQNKLNQARLFQQEFAAKQLAGQIMASAPNEEEGIKRITQSPAFPFMGTQLAQYRQMQLTLEQLSGTKADNNDKALKLAIHGASQAMNDPSQLPRIQKEVVAMLPPQIAERMTPVINGMYQGLTAGLPGDPKGWGPEQSAKYRANLNGMLFRGGVGSDEIRASYGGVKPEIKTITNPDGTQSFIQVGQDLSGQNVSPTGGAPTPAGNIFGASPGGAASIPGKPPPGALGGPFGQTTEQAETQKGFAKSGVENKEQLDANVDSVAMQMRAIQEMRDAMTKFTPGAGSSFNQHLAGLAQWLKMDRKIVDGLSGGDYGALQEFKKLATQTTMAQLKTQIPAGSKMAQQEWQTFQRDNVNIDTDPRAIEKIFNFWTRVYGALHSEQQWLNQRLDEGMPIKNWKSEWQEEMKKRGMLKPEVTDTSGNVADSELKTLDDIKKAVEDKRLTPDEAYAKAVAKKLIRDDRVPAKGNP